MKFKDSIPDSDSLTDLLLNRLLNRNKFQSNLNLSKDSTDPRPELIIDSYGNILIEFKVGCKFSEQVKVISDLINLRDEI